MRALLLMVAGACSACASTGAKPSPFPLPGSGTSGASGASAESRPASLPPGAPGGAARPAGRAGGYEISGTALALRGKPYRSGGADPNGFDCSGLVRYVFAQHGMAVPRTVGEQYRAGGEVPAADLQPGDLVFFSTTAPGASHVGIVVGGDSFVHAPASTGVVRVDRLEAPYWSSRFIGARRIHRN